MIDDGGSGTIERAQVRPESAYEFVVGVSNGEPIKLNAISTALMFTKLTSMEGRSNVTC